MINLRDLIRSLEPELYKRLEQSLTMSQAGNFLHLLVAYRESEKQDDEIRTELDISKNSYYALKSRLHDKIEDVLGGDISSSRAKVVEMLHRIPEVCNTQPDEIAETFLNKLAKDLLAYDMHGDLLQVYSALKKINLYSEKYFHYSQLFNKHTAYSLSLEKADELLGNFNQQLIRYRLQPSSAIAQSLQFIRDGINDHFKMNGSRQIRLISNVVELQTAILADIPRPGLDIPQTIAETERILEEMPDSMQLSHWNSVLLFLQFKNSMKTRQYSTARQYHDELMEVAAVLPLVSHIALTPLFFLSRVVYVQRSGLKISEHEAGLKLLSRPADKFAFFHINLYQSVCYYLCGDIRQAIRVLNNLINDYNFNDAFHAEMEVKLSLAFFYIRLKDSEHASNILKKLQRKIKSGEWGAYAHVLRLIKLLDKFPEQRISLTDAHRDEFTLFVARNNNEYKVMEHLLPELEKIFS
jgi:tetratricopeptide (TPR) repeat protein